MSDSATKKILLVEGDPDLRQMLATVLSSRSRDVTSAGSAREFRDLQNADRFDLAVLDLNLPDDSGFAIVRFLRQSSPARIIVHTRRDTLTDRVEAYTQGADIYMVKPTPERNCWRPWTRCSDAAAPRRGPTSRAGGSIRPAF